MLSWILLLVDADARAAARRARSWFAQAHPGDAEEGVTLLSREAGRYVFRIWYHPPQPQRPSPYVVVGVERSSDAVYEIDLEKFPQFRKRGHK